MPCLLGFLFAGTYGVIHDEITYSISSEYFTKIKFQQFDWVVLSSVERVNVAIIGFLASSWVGLFIAWFLGRWHLKAAGENEVSRKIYISYIIVFAFVLVFGGLGYIYGLLVVPQDLPPASVSSSIRINDVTAFIRVAYIHYFGYAGALIGFFSSMFVIKRDKV